MLSPVVAAMVCCRCNRRGLCKGCSCVKDGRPCIDCLPCREDNCHNSTPAVSIEPCPTLTGRTLGDRASQSLTRSSSTTSPSPLSSDLSFHSADSELERPNVAVDEDHVADLCPPSCPRGICDLPHFEELADPQFVWFLGRPYLRHCHL